MSGACRNSEQIAGLPSGGVQLEQLRPSHDGEATRRLSQGQVDGISGCLRDTGTSGTNDRRLNRPRFQKIGSGNLLLSTNWSGWQELNLRGHVPRTCGWPLPYTRMLGEGLAALSDLP